MNRLFAMRNGASLAKYLTDHGFYSPSLFSRTSQDPHAIHPR